MTISEAFSKSDHIKRQTWGNDCCITFIGDELHLCLLCGYKQEYELTKEEILADNWEPNGNFHN